jgi:hypothetical protein
MTDGFATQFVGDGLCVGMKVTDRQHNLSDFAGKDRIGLTK